jgi:hypothetical protein
MVSMDVPKECSSGLPVYGSPELDDAGIEEYILMELQCAMRGWADAF